MQIKTATTVAGINAVDFGNTSYRFYWIKNVGATTVHVSTKSDITAGSDGVAEIAAGECVMLENYDSVIYVLGAGKVEIYETEYNICPFKSAAKGGGSDEAVKLEIITEFPENPKDYKFYLYKGSDLGDILAVHYNDIWNFAALNQYPFRYKLSAAELFAIGQLIDTSENALSIIDRTTEFSDNIFTKSIRLYGLQQDSITITYEISIDFKSATNAKLYYGISSETADKCTIYLNNVVIEKDISGTSSMTENKREVTFVPTAGVNKLKFVYKKDSSQSIGEDSVFIYAVDFTAGG